MKIMPFFAASLLALAVNANAASLVGDTIDVAMISTIDNGYGTGRLLGFGLDGPFVVMDGSADIKQYSGAFTIDVDGNDFAIKFLDLAGWQDGTVLSLTGLNFDGTGSSFLRDIEFDTNLVGYSVKIGSDYAEIGLGGTQFSTDTYMNGHFITSSVPEPTSMHLFALGLAGLIPLIRKRAAVFANVA